MTFWNIIKSTLAAGIGVQSKKNLRHDFSQQTATPYIMAGLIFVIIFITSLVFIIKLILYFAT